MKRPILLSLVLMLSTAHISAGAAPAPSKDEKNLEKEIARIDRTASIPDGERAVVRRIGADFKVSEEDVRRLRARNIGYGEIVTTYSLARLIPGGITDANVQRIIAIRQGPPPVSWGQVARQLNTKLSPAVSQSKKLNDESHRDMKRGPSAGGSGPHPSRHDGAVKGGDRAPQGGGPR